MGEEIATSAHPPRPQGPRARLLPVVAAVVLAATLTACGGEERQDADEPSGNFPVEVTQARFPTEQRLAETSDLRLAVKNIGDQTIPDLAITIHTGDEPATGPFNIRSDQPGLADPNRPVWILEHQYPKLLESGISPAELDAAPTAGAEAAQTNTFSFGALPPGKTKQIVWRVTPVRPGTFTVHYEVAAGLQGNAKAVTRDGNEVDGEFVVTISDKPPKARVNEAGEAVVQE